MKDKVVIDIEPSLEAMVPLLATKIMGWQLQDTLAGFARWDDDVLSIVEEINNTMPTPEGKAFGNLMEKDHA